MSRKRYIKLLMSRGVKRNTATEMAMRANADLSFDKLYAAFHYWNTKSLFSELLHNAATYDKTLAGKVRETEDGFIRVFHMAGVQQPVLPGCAPAFMVS